MTPGGMEKVSIWGAHDGSYVTHHTYVIGNYIHDLNAPSVDQGDGIEIKDGSSPGEEEVQSGPRRGDEEYS